MYAADVWSRLSGRRIIAQALFGVVGGALLAWCGGVFGPLLVESGNAGWGDLIAGMMGAAVGYTLGAPLGVWLAARLLGVRGSLLRSLFGSAFGAAAVLLLAEPLRLNQQAWLLVTAGALAVLLGALVGFHARRASNTTQRTVR